MVIAEYISLLTGAISLIQLGILCAIYERLGNYKARIESLEKRIGHHGFITTA